MCYKLKIRGSVKSFVVLFTEHPTSPCTEFLVKAMIKAKASKPRQKITKCQLFTNGGDWVKSFDYLI